MFPIPSSNNFPSLLRPSRAQAGRVFALGMFLAAGASQAALPNSATIPAPPPGSAALKSGEAPPNLSGQATPGAPAISQLTEITQPDETLSIAGEGLGGATLKLWAGDQVREIQPLRSDAQRLQAVIPKEIRPGVMLVWPEKAGKVGEPFRVNAPTVWWTFPTKPNPGEELRIMGKNLTAGEQNPTVMLADTSGKSLPLGVKSANSYEIRATLPDDLPPGEYFLQTHTGTGGAAGWSERFAFECLPAIAEPELVISIEEKDVGKGGITGPLLAAIQKAVSAGGAVIELPAGHYELEKTPVVLPKGVPIILRGRGEQLRPLLEEGRMGWWFRSQGTAPSTSFATHRGKAGNPSLFRLEGDGSRLENLGLTMVSNKASSAVELRGRRQAIRNVRMICSSPYVWDQRLVDIDGVENADIVIEGCDFIIYSTAVAIHKSGGIRYTNNRVLGNYVMGRAVEANALRVEDTRGLIVENSNFRSVDRRGGRMLGRTALFSHNNCRNILAQNNTTTDAGPTPAIMSVDGNISEQYLFHSFKEVVGDFPVVSATPTTLVPGPDARKAVPADFFANNTIVIFVTKGKGAGQFRTVTKRDADGTLHLEKPWRVVPDSTSVVTIDRRFRQIAVVNNIIDPTPDPELLAELRDQKYKTVGIFYFYNAFDTVTDGNTIRNTSSGVSIAERVGTSTGWNTVRNNTMENMAGFTGATTFAPAFISQNARARRSNNVAFEGWLSAGNVFRANKGRGADLAGYQGWLWQDAPGRAPVTGFVPAPANGSMLTVIENNDFEGTQRGFLFSAPANWTLFRNNTIKVDAEGQALVEVSDSAPPDSLLVLPESQLQGNPGPKPRAMGTAPVPEVEEEAEE